MEKREEDMEINGIGSEEAASPSVIDSIAAAEEQEELDPVKLKGAFRFAAWSSIILVRPMFLGLCCADNLLLAAGPNYLNPFATLLCTNYLWRHWIVGMGDYWDYLDVYVCVLGCALPFVGESRGAETNRKRDCKGVSFA